MLPDSLSLYHNIGGFNKRGAEILHLSFIFRTQREVMTRLSTFGNMIRQYTDCLKFILMYSKANYLFILTPLLINFLHCSTIVKDCQAAVFIELIHVEWIEWRGYTLVVVLHLLFLTLMRCLIEKCMNTGAFWLPFGCEQLNLTQITSYCYLQHAHYMNLQQ